MQSTALHLELHLLEVHTSTWCDTCSLPSAVLYRGALVNATTLRVCGHVDGVTCPDCGTTRKARANEDHQ